MRVLLNHLSVTMILSVVVGSVADEVDDLSDVCSRGRSFYSYLTTGAGLTDKSVAMLATENKLDCTLVYSVKDNHHIMLVLEFPDLEPQERVCISEQSTSILVSDYNKKYTCQENGALTLYNRLAYENMSIRFKTTKKLKTVKITATSLRASEDFPCSSFNETECLVNHTSYCMTSATVCDGNINCGVHHMYDEELEKCEGVTPTFSMIFGSLVMVLISIMLIISLCIVLLPKRGDVFVYRFDQTMSLFDNENGIVNVEIDIQILLPTETIYHQD